MEVEQADFYRCGLPNFLLLPKSREDPLALQVGLDWGEFLKRAYASRAHQELRAQVNFLAARRAYD